MYQLNEDGRGRVCICMFVIHRLNIELDLQSLCGLHVYSWNHWLRPRNLPPPHLGSFAGALLVSQDIHLFVTPWCDSMRVEEELLL